MIYRHIYTDPNPCPACEGYDTEPSNVTGRKCADCGHSREDAFDPDRDPFNPEREGWTGWVKSGARFVMWTDAGRTWTVRPSKVQAPSGDPVPGTRIIYDPVVQRSRTVYNDRPIPHRTVVSILVSNGYVPE